MNAARGGGTPREPERWVFAPENRAKIDAIIKRYPPGRQASAVLACLDLAQRQHGWVPQAAIEHIGEILGLAAMRVTEVASFYSMIARRPQGRFLVQVCGTTPCWLRDSDGLFAALHDELRIGRSETTADGLFTLVEVECLGACVNAPVAQINDDFYEDLTAETLLAVLRQLRSGGAPKAGSQSGRHSSEPAAGQTSHIASRSE